jgi:hypothetical protein
MRSKLGEDCREEVVEICRRMSPAERLQAFVNHCRAFAEIHAAGELARRELSVDRRGHVDRGEPSCTTGP